MLGFLEEISNISGLPFEEINGGFRVINMSNHAIYVEGFVSLIDVTAEEIAIKLKKGILKLNGDHLKIKNMNLNSMIVVGNIQAVEMG